LAGSTSTSSTRIRLALPVGIPMLAPGFAFQYPLTVAGFVVAS
jgi:hypothetical protein